MKSKRAEFCLNSYAQNLSHRILSGEPSVHVVVQTVQHLLGVCTNLSRGFPDGL